MNRTRKGEIQRPGPRTRRGRSAVVLAALAGLLILAAASCKSSSTSTTEATINVANNSGATVNVYLDGTLKLTLTDAGNSTIENVGAGTRLIEIYTSDSGLLILSKSLTVEVGGNYAVVAEGVGSLRISNAYGEILSIYQDGSYLGDIGDQISLVITKIRFGGHTYEARQRGGTTAVASTTFQVTDASEHSWLIAK
jgi:hypothetical protein